MCTRMYTICIERMNTINIPSYKIKSLIDLANSYSSAVLCYGNDVKRNINIVKLIAQFNTLSRTIAFLTKFPIQLSQHLTHNNVFLFNLVFIF